MKTVAIYLTVTAALMTLAAVCFAQSDSIIYLKETDFSFYSIHKVKYQSTGEIKTERQLIDLENVSALTFLSNDSLALTKHAGDPVYTKLTNIKDVSKYRYHFSPVLGAILGAAGGAIIGAITGYTFSGNDVNENEPFWQLGKEFEELEGADYGALIGALGGATIGGFVSEIVNHVSIDMLLVPDKDKKTKLIKFLRNK